MRLPLFGNPKGKPARTTSAAIAKALADDDFEKLIADPRIRLLAEPQGLDPLWVAFSKREDKNHLLWTDDYLAAFAQAADAELVTFDRALSKRYTSVRITCLFTEPRKSRVKGR